MNNYTIKSRIHPDSSEVTLPSEVEAQLKELDIPDNHLGLVKHIVVLSRQDAKTKLGEEFASSMPEAFLNAEKGAIGLIVDFRWDLGHEIGHLVWRLLMTNGQKESFKELMDREEEEYQKFWGKVLTKFAPKLYAYHDPRSEELEEEFCWAYSFYLLMHNYSEFYPATYKWMKENVFTQ